MFTYLKLSFENFLNSSSACFMFVDGYTGIGKTLFAKEILKDFNVSSNGEVKALQAPYIYSEREFISSLFEVYLIVKIIKL
jgi:Cdc6-like AAA superfamily ATPase